jgi:hypothetical protein
MQIFHWCQQCRQQIATSANDAEAAGVIDTGGQQRQRQQIAYTQCCGSGMFIPDPGSRLSSIPDPKPDKNKKRAGKFCFLPFYVAINFHKNVKLFNYEKVNKNMGRFVCTVLISTLLHLHPRNMGLGSQIQKKLVPDPG